MKHIFGNANQFYSNIFHTQQWFPHSDFGVVGQPKISGNLYLYLFYPSERTTQSIKYLWAICPGSTLPIYRYWNGAMLVSLVLRGWVISNMGCSQADHLLLWKQHHGWKIPKHIVLHDFINQTDDTESQQSTHALGDWACMCALRWTIKAMEADFVDLWVSFFNYRHFPLCEKHWTEVQLITHTHTKNNKALLIQLKALENNEVFSLDCQEKVHPKIKKCCHCLCTLLPIEI